MTGAASMRTRAKPPRGACAARRRRIDFEFAISGRSTGLDEIDAVHQRRFGRAAERIVLVAFRAGPAGAKLHAVAHTGYTPLRQLSPAELRPDAFFLAEGEPAQHDRLITIALPVGDFVAPIFAEALVQAAHRGRGFGIEERVEGCVMRPGLSNPAGGRSAGCGSTEARPLVGV